LHHFDEIDLAFGEFGQFGVGADLRFEVGELVFDIDLDGFLVVLKLTDFIGEFLILPDKPEGFGIVVDFFLGLFQEGGSLMGGDPFSQGRLLHNECQVLPRSSEV